MNTVRDTIAFVLCGAFLPCLFLTITGTPGALCAWVAAWIVLTLTEKRHVAR